MATEILDARLNARLPRRVKADLTALARRRRQDESELARTLLDEGIRRENHPGIVFRTGAGGRDAAIEGRRLYIWQVMETVWNSDGNIEDAAASLGIRADQVDTATGYYLDYPEEIDAAIASNKEEADRLQERAQRRAGAARR